MGLLCFNLVLAWRYFNNCIFFYIIAMIIHVFTYLFPSWILIYFICPFLQTRREIWATNLACKFAFAYVISRIVILHSFCSFIYSWSQRHHTLQASWNFSLMAESINFYKTVVRTISISILLADGSAEKTCFHWRFVSMENLWSAAATSWVLDPLPVMSSVGSACVGQMWSAENATDASLVTLDFHAADVSSF